jgi:hypothetical protein
LIYSQVGDSLRNAILKYENSTYKPGRVDTPKHAATFLKEFLATNQDLLKKTNVSRVL